ncbi:progestin and adipoQ receptor family member 3a isoform X3 [Pristis pectinata]|uniref:progestin and adipoQ receptor family member 3a isoform X3 n=1 Tax=Pristis pectinata TaxID=685728 RepID=UPI00223CFA76|nr:progestin and adipoQ receptor family member 3a isoform X3 [Pristis pectinata]
MVHLLSCTMPQKLLKSAHFIELGNYHYWPVLVPRGIRLYTYEQIPSFLKDNPYITDGYRAYLPSKLCLKSLFILSNETVNIWSHLLGFFLFFGLGIYDMTIVLPEANASRDDYVIYSVCLFCFQVCMLCSVGYHLFCCHRSEKANRRWLALDYAGIAIGILGCYVPAVFYAFYCNEISLQFLFQKGRKTKEVQAVLATGVLNNGAGYDIGSILCTNTSLLPHSAVVQLACTHFLLCFCVWVDPNNSLDLAEWRDECTHSSGTCSTHICDVFHGCSGFFSLRHKNSRKIFPRAGELHWF